MLFIQQPLLSGDLVGPEVGLVDAHQEDALAHELRHDPRYPQSLVVEGWVVVLDRPSVEWCVLEHELLF